ncbi:unnamed protein product [Acanthoscelides obtectus]|uniref:Uncharacterized protein n=1 Tax=Acanthoscelides obtectus TaxID=200917 RepID=A0A9P0KFQ2_ACAOB|nr:unnamed protein product [Acanthoscelides obtectus]CAK1627673.1 hypothetical protein AOBTE_LOCUS4758 [Acanthoscelides obtectus]
MPKREGNKAFRKYQILKSPASLEYYQKLRNDVISAIRREKAAYLSFNEQLNSNKHLWKASLFNFRESKEIFRT